MDRNRVLVTGAAGLIGSRLVARLEGPRFDCLGIDNLVTGCSAPARRSHFDFYMQDICESDKVMRIFTDFRPEIVVHLAAIHHIPTCESNPSKALHVNVVGSQIVLEAAAAVGCRKFILASTGGIYDWQEGALTEQTPLRPTDIYTLSKATNERQLSLWVEKTGQTGVIARIFNTIGKNDPNGHLIPDILRQLKSNGQQSLVSLGNLHTQRDYIYVEDTAACLALIVETEHLNGLEVFNIGTGKQYDVQYIAEGIARIKKCSIAVRSDPKRIRKVDRASQLADITKASRELGWRPEVSLDEALRLIVSEDV